MAQKASDEEVCHALLDFISDGTYPGSENVIASEFPASALSKEIELISNARKRVEVSTRPPVTKHMRLSIHD